MLLTPSRAPRVVDRHSPGASVRTSNMTSLGPETGGPDDVPLWNNRVHRVAPERDNPLDFQVWSVEVLRGGQYSDEHVAADRHAHRLVSRHSAHEKLPMDTSWPVAPTPNPGSDHNRRQPRSHIPTSKTVAQRRRWAKRNSLPSEPLRFAPERRQSARDVRPPGISVPDWPNTR